MNDSKTMNSSYKSHGDLDDIRHLQVPIVLMYSLLILVAVGGNVLVCYIVLGNSKMRSTTNFFLVSLAISDITKAVLCIPFTFVANFILNYWPFGGFMCPLVTYMQIVAVFASAFTLVTMSIDRFVAVVYPLRPRLTKRKAVMIILATWALAFLVPIPTAVTAQVSLDGLCLENWDREKIYVYSLIIMMMQYFVPLGFLTITYGKIGYAVWIKKTPGEALQARDDRIAASKRKMIKMMIVVVVIYAVCWLPLHAVTLVGDKRPEIWDVPYMKFIWLCFHWLAMSHSCYNPIVYFWMNATFRRGLKLVFRHCLPLKDSDNRNGFSTASKHSYSNIQPSQLSLRTHHTMSISSGSSHEHQDKKPFTKVEF